MLTVDLVPFLSRAAHVLQYIFVHEGTREECTQEDSAVFLQNDNPVIRVTRHKFFFLTFKPEKRYKLLLTR